MVEALDRRASAAGAPEADTAAVEDVSTKLLPGRRDVPALILLTLAYASLAVLGLRFAMVPGAGTALWPAAGVALAALMIGGVRLWPAVVAGRLLTAVIVASPQPIWADLTIAIGTTAGAVVPVLLRHAARPRKTWTGGLGDLAWLVLSGALLGAAISATVGVLALWASGTPVEKTPLLWLTWASGFVVGVLTLTPPALAWCAPGAFRYGRAEWLHLGLCLAVCAAVGALVFLDPGGGPLRTWNIFPALIWAGVVFYGRGAPLAVLITAVVVVAAVVLDTGPILTVSNGPLEALLYSQHFMATVAVTVLLLAAAGEERAQRGRLAQQRLTELRQSNERARREAESRLAAEEQLREAKKMEALGRLTGGVAHDFNNLLTVIRGAAALMRKPDLSPEKAERYLDAVDKAAVQGAALTGQLLAFARKQVLSPRVLNPGAVLRESGVVLSRALGETATLRLEVPDDLPAVRADRSQLEIALLNLALNARDAMPNGGEVTVSARADDGSAVPEVVITVRDAGSGMDPAVAEKAFEPFFTTKALGEGTGLGLSQVYGFARQSGGRAWIDTERGRGTAVSIALPATDERPSPEAVAAAPGFAPGGTVLLVEDNREVAELAAAMLADLGFSVVHAPDGERALHWLADGGSPRVILTDMLMPGVDGLTVADAAREADASVPVIVATGHSDQLSREGLERYPLLRKPYSRVELAAALERALAGASPSADAASISDA